MPRRSFTVSLFLMDGEVNGKIKATITNWNGVAYKIPRELLGECRDFEAFSHSGVYFLLDSRNVYIGQAEVRANGGALYQRVFEHTSDRLGEVWDEVIIFTRRDNSLGRTDISFLENYFHEQLVNSNRFIVQNNNRPTQGTVTEEKRSELEEYADSAELILGFLGYKLFVPTITLPIQAPTPIHSCNPSMAPKNQTATLPALPEANLKIGNYVYTALTNLCKSGYVFDDSDINEMCTPSWSSEHFHTVQPFMKRYIPGRSDNRGSDGRVRFKAEPFTFGEVKVYISKEWYERQRKYFDTWYLKL